MGVLEGRAGVQHHRADHHGGLTLGRPGPVDRGEGLQCSPRGHLDDPDAVAVSATALAAQTLGREEDVTALAVSAQQGGRRIGSLRDGEERLSARHGPGHGYSLP